MVGVSATASQAVLGAAANTSNLRVLAQGLNGASWSLRGAGLLQDGSRPCAESLQFAALLFGLSVMAISIVVAFAFFREDKEESITPLCPQLVIREPMLSFTLGQEADNNIRMTDLNKGSAIATVAADCPDSTGLGRPGISATARIQNALGQTLATVVARRNASVGQSLALCRAGCEIFGFVTLEGSGRYAVRHRTGVLLLWLRGDFATMEVEGINPVGTKVCWFTSKDGVVKGCVQQHVDAGLVICGVLAVLLRRTLEAGDEEPQCLALPLLKAPEARPTEDASADPFVGAPGAEPQQEQQEQPPALPPPGVTTIFRLPP